MKSGDEYKSEHTKPGHSTDFPPQSTFAKPRLSVIIPVYNEKDNLVKLHEQLTPELTAIGEPYEVVYVDDGSTDGSTHHLRQIADSDDRVIVVCFRRNFGQTCAMAAGIDHSVGEIIVFMDADLQNDPADIPRLLEELQKGYDIAGGWRKGRQDTWLFRRVPSFVANKLISWVTGVRLRDYGCTLKAYRREILENIQLYGEMHRFIPALAARVGATVSEIPVRHHPRKQGQSKYGLDRTFRVVLDLLTVKFLASFFGNPIYLFGGMGLTLLLLSLISGTGMLIQKLTQGVSFIQTPLLLLSALFVLLGFQSIFLGLLAEMVVRTYHESQRKPVYVVKEIFK